MSGRIVSIHPPATVKMALEFRAFIVIIHQITGNKSATTEISIIKEKAHG